MADESFAQVAKRRLLGVLMIVVIAGLITLSIAVYEKAFTSTDTLTLKADHTGNALILDSDVKIRGLIVGSVSDISSNGEYAVVKLAIEPDKMKFIPSNVTAQILPKTLFGEQYVALNIPANPSPNRIKNNATIPQDRSQGALETEKVLGDLLPLLTAVKPAELNATLNAVATALHDKGPELGRTLTNFDKYLKIINPRTKALVDDVKKLGEVALEYNNLAPDIFGTLSNLETSVRTVVQKQGQIDSLLRTGSSTAGILQSFLSDNEQRLIDVTGQTDKVYRLLDEYSPEFTCLLAGINSLQQKANTAIYDNMIHLSATVDQSNPGKYKQGQEPRLITGFGPNCFGLPDNVQPVDENGHFQFPDKYRCINDGAPLTSDPCAASPNTALNSPEENALVNALIAKKLGTTPDQVSGTATLLAAPLLRGHQVVVK